MKIGVKFCGNCNPQFDSMWVLAELKKKAPDLEFVSFEEPEVDAILVLSGCLTDCATRPDFRGRMIVVAGNTISGLVHSPSALVDVLLDRLRKEKRSVVEQC